MRQAKPWKGGSDELETFHRKPAGSTPARQRRSPPAGSECCMVDGNVHREAYTAGGEATHIEPRNRQCWCLHCSDCGGSTGSAVKARRHGPAGVEERSQSHGMACQGTWETRFRPCGTAVGGDDRLQTNPGPERLPAAAPGARERRHEHAGAHGTGRRNNKPKGSGIGGRSAFIVLLKTGNRGHRDPDEGREASHGRATGGKRWRRHRASQTRQRNNSG